MCMPARIQAHAHAHIHTPDHSLTAQAAVRVSTRSQYSLKPVWTLPSQKRVSIWPPVCLSPALTWRLLLFPYFHALLPTGAYVCHSESVRCLATRIQAHSSLNLDQKKSTFVHLCCILLYSGLGNIQVDLLQFSLKHVPLLWLRKSGMSTAQSYICSPSNLINLLIRLAWIICAWLAIRDAIRQVNLSCSSFSQKLKSVTMVFWGL